MLSFLIFFFVASPIEYMCFSLMFAPKSPRVSALVIASKIYLHPRYHFTTKVATLTISTHP